MYNATKNVIENNDESLNLSESAIVIVGILKEYLKYDSFSMYSLEHSHCCVIFKASCVEQ